LVLLLETVSGMDQGPSSLSLSTLESQLIQLQEQVEVLHQENMEDKERIVHLEQITQELEGRVSLLESVCNSTQMDTEISGPLMAIAGSTGRRDSTTGMWLNLRSAEVLDTSCDFPLPDGEGREAHISVTTVDGKTLVCGGAGRKDQKRHRNCLQFNSQSKTWEHHSQLKQLRRAASAIELKRGVYILGGIDDPNSSEFLATGSSVWTEGPPIPGLGVYLSCAAKLSDTEFVILGGSLDRSQALVYNEESDEWREWPRLKDEVSSHSCVSLGDTVLMAGGYSNDVTTARTVIFDSKTGSAREVASLNYPRQNAAMGFYGKRPAIFGGKYWNVEEWNFPLKSDGEIWNMDTETWEEADISLNIARSGFSLVNLAEDIDLKDC